MSWLSENFNTLPLSIAGNDAEYTTETIQDLINRGVSIKDIAYKMSLSMIDTNRESLSIAYMNNQQYSLVRNDEAYVPEYLVNENAERTSTFSSNTTNRGVYIVALYGNRDTNVTEDDVSPLVKPHIMPISNVNLYGEDEAFYLEMMTNLENYHILSFDFSKLMLELKVGSDVDDCTHNINEFDGDIGAFRVNVWYGDEDERISLNRHLRNDTLKLYAFSYYTNNVVTGITSDGHITPATGINEFYGAKNVHIDDVVNCKYYIHDDDSVQGYLNKFPLNYLDLKRDSSDEMTCLTRENIIHLMNELGCFYVLDGNVQASLTSESVFLPIIDDDGATGEATNGENNVNNSKWNLHDPAEYEKPYQDEIFIDDNDYVDTIELGSPTLTPINTFCSYWCATKPQINALNDFLWTTDETMWKSIIDGLQLLNSPIEFMSNLKLFPFDLSAYGSGARKAVYAGRVYTGVDMTPLNDDYHVTLDGGSCKLIGYNKDFSDYSNSKAFIYIPYCGSREISMVDFMNKTITCKYVVDVVTGSCVACIFANNIPMFYASGNMGCDIPITASNTREQANAVMSATMGVGGSVVGSLSSGDFMSIFESADGLRQALTSLTSQQSGSGSPYSSFSLPQYCYVVVEKANEVIPSNYGATHGYTVFDNYKLSSLKGFTICADSKLNISHATDEEVDMIKSLLNSGVIL